MTQKINIACLSQFKIPFPETSLLTPLGFVLPLNVATVSQPQAPQIINK